MRSLRSPLPIRPLRVAASFAARSLLSFSWMRAASTCIALALLRCCERSSWHSATMPVGRCVMRTAESVLFTCWPPAPEARKVSMRRSAGLICTAWASSGSGNAATVQALHAIDTLFELVLAVAAFAHHADHLFLEAALVPQALAHHLRAPVLELG